jgi:hypothetical protein
MALKVQLSGGGFQDSEGNVLALGYLKFRLSQDEEVNGLQICSGVEITINLDASGNVVAGQYIWGNDVLSPINSYYTVTGYTAAGQPAWGPNNQQVVGTGTFNLGTWVPNQVISWLPSMQSGTSVQVEGVPLSSSTIADFVNSGNVTFTDIGGGQIEATASATALLEVAGVPLSAGVADFVNTGNVTFTDEGGGEISATVSGIGTALEHPFWSTDFSMQEIGITGTYGLGGTNGSIFCTPLFLSTPTTIKAVTTKMTGGYVGTFAVAIYSWDGLTKYWESGAFDESLSTVQTFTFTPVTIPAGLYRFAIGSQDSGILFSWGVNIADGNTMFNLNGALQLVLASALYSAPMPSTLGIFEVTPNNNTGWPGFFLQ